MRKSWVPLRDCVASSRRYARASSENMSMGITFFCSAERSVYMEMNDDNVMDRTRYTYAAIVVSVI